MTDDEKLDKEIEELRVKHALNKELKERLPGISGFSYLGIKNEKNIHLEITTKEELKRILEVYPSVQTSFVIGTATDKHYKEIAAPYRLNLSNGIRDKNLIISYTSNDNVEIRIKAKPELIKDYIRHGSRGVTDCEYHYFGGVSMAEIIKMQIFTNEFIGEQMGWFGGDKTLLDANKIVEIMKSLTDEEK